MTRTLLSRGSTAIAGTVCARDTAVSLVTCTEPSTWVGPGGVLAAVAEAGTKDRDRSTSRDNENRRLTTITVPSPSRSEHGRAGRGPGQRALLDDVGRLTRAIPGDRSITRGQGPAHSCG